MNHIKQTVLSLSLALVSSCANPMSGLQFACDPDDPSTCISGYVCVRAEPWHKYKGVCKPAQEADIPRDSGGKDLYQSDPGFTRDALEGVCVPSCSGKQCGPDGCGGSCGQCGPDLVCTSDGVCSTVAGSEFQVNTWTTSGQGNPSITSLSNGGFVVVWQSGCLSGCTGQDGSGYGVYGQRFDSNGNKVGSQFQVSTWTTTFHQAPSITSLSNGGFVVVWSSKWQDGSDYGVFGRRFDASGNAAGVEFQVNTWTTDDQQSPSITSLSNGGFVVVWQSRRQDGSGWGVYGQRFDSNGNKVGSEFQVNTWTTDDQGNPSITSLSNGGFVVVWESVGQDGSGYGVYGRIFSQ